MTQDAPLADFRPTELIDPFEIHVGPVFEKGPPGAKTYVIRVDARHMNRRGVLHGGMFLTLADMTLGQAVWDATDRAPSATLNMQMHFLKSAIEGDMIEVTPEVTRRTRSLVFARGDFKVAGTICVTASSVWKLLGRG
jgi:uncharacterized protein (TIGR00369 family)